jgi:hypothetical protein
LAGRGRLLLAALGLLLIGLLATARGLTPDPRGYGTHEQLGLAPCGFARWTGLRCPTCGMTTAWSLAVRGEFKAALASSLSGALLCGLSIAAAAWTLGSAIAGNWIVTRPTAPLLLTLGGAWFAVTVLDWLRRLATG